MGCPKAPSRAQARPACGALRRSVLVPTRRAHCSHAVAQALAKTLQTRKRPRRGFLVDTAVLLDTGGNTHHFAQAIDDDELAVRVARDDHVEAVRP